MATTATPQRKRRANPPVCGRRNCTTCGRWRLLVDFDCKDTRGTLYILGTCQPCLAEYKKEHYRKNEQAYKDKARRWRDENADRKRENHREWAKRNRVKRREYANRPKVRRRIQAQQRRNYYKRKRRLTARIPAEVVRPWVDMLRRQAAAEQELTEAKWPGLQALAKYSGVHERTLRRILERELVAVEPTDVDKLAMLADFTLAEMYDRAAEWAELTGSTWPLGKGFASRGDGGPNVRRRISYDPAKHPRDSKGRYIPRKP